MSHRRRKRRLPRTRFRPQSERSIHANRNIRTSRANLLGTPFNPKLEIALDAFLSPSIVETRTVGTRRTRRQDRTRRLCLRMKCHWSVSRRKESDQSIVISRRCSRPPSFHSSSPFMPSECAVCLVCSSRRCSRTVEASAQCGRSLDPTKRAHRLWKDTMARIARTRTSPHPARYRYHGQRHHLRFTTVANTPFYLCTLS